MASLSRLRAPLSFVLALSGVAAVSACGGAAPPAPAPAPRASAPAAPLAMFEEKHFGDVRQLTAGGENAEAYWSWSGKELILQARSGDKDCDRIYRMPLAGFLGDAPPKPGTMPARIPVSSGEGVTTCSYFFPGDKEVLYASTHLGGAACPPKPDHSLGYVWPLYDTYDIFKADADGKNPVRLTDAKGYDAEATVCAKDGSIVFTSVRDGDIDLYRMDKDGKNVVRLTSTPGYDGGAFFNADCSKIVWRASRPKPGPELDDFKRLLGQNLVRPSKLELYVANADGSDAKQITYLNAASFAPFWHPNGKRILFSTNHGDPKGREFDIWAVDEGGTNLERITWSKGFDGFPMFSPDGKWLAFASNRATPEGKHDTNVFLARWIDDVKPKRDESAADRVRDDVAWLADPEREGRGIGTKGLEVAGTYIESRMKRLGLEPAGDAGSFRQAFPVTTSLKAEQASVDVEKKPLADGDFVVLGYSPSKFDVSADAVFADYGIVAKDAGLDDYAKLDPKGKVVVVRRFVPESPKLATPEAQRRYGDIRRKAWTAREKGAKALVVVDLPSKPEGAKADWKMPDEAKMPTLQPEGYSDAGIPVVVVKRDAGKALVEKLQKKQKAVVHVAGALTPVQSNAFNVAGRLAADPADGRKLPGVVVIGAHYDHLGKGGRHSLAPMSEEPHVGADDNASGTAALLEAARELAARRSEIRRDVLFLAFSGEESGVLGSAHFVHTWTPAKAAVPVAVPREGAKAGPPAAPKLDGVVAMLNMDMVGRLRDNRLQVLGTETAAEWGDLLGSSCAAQRVECAGSGDGYGPSDQMSFYAAGVPVLHFFSGTHGDYHKPSDTADKINAAGLAQTSKIVQTVALALAQRETGLTYKGGLEGPSPRGDMRSFNASLGTIPDYGGPGAGKKGVLLAGVRPGGGADKGGLKKGDVLVRLGKSEIGSVEDLMFVLNASKPGETVPAVVLRDGKEVKLEVTFQESQRPK